MLGKRLRKLDRAGSTAGCEPCTLASRHARLKNQAPQPLLAKPELRWWRLELDAQGQVRSCTAVEQRGAEGEIQFIYVQAHDAKQAGRLAWNEHVKLETRRRRAALVAAGKCQWCARENDRPPGKRCTKCLSQEKKRETEQRQGIAARPRLVALADRRDQDRADWRVEVLREVWRVMDDLDAGDFRAWLEREARLGQPQEVEHKPSPQLTTILRSSNERSGRLHAAGK